VTPLYPQKLALTSPTGGGRSVGIVRSRTKATEREWILNSDLFPFQLGVTLVVSPLVSLMEDQLTALKVLDVPAAMLSATSTREEVKSIQEVCNYY